jgi:hypothetical protein
MAYILGEVCTRTPCPVVDRGWKAVDSVFTDWDDAVVKHSKTGMLWVPMRKLMAKARRKREADILISKTAAFQPPFCSDRSTNNPAPSTSGLLAAGNFAPLPTEISEIFDADKFSGLDVTRSIQQSYAPGEYQDTRLPQVSGMGLSDYASAQPPMQAQITAQYSQAENRPWILDDSALPDLNTIDGDMSQEGWSDMVSYFHMETETSQPDDRYPPYPGMGFIL